MTWSVAALSGSLAWGAIAYAMLRRNARIEFGIDERLPPLLGVALAVLCALAAFALPAPWNASIAFAVAGYGIASWGDFRSSILWDEIIVGTILLDAAIAAVGGRSALALEGAAACGAFMYLMYWAALLCNRETGFGDVKLAFGIGLALGVTQGLAALSLGCLAWLATTFAWAAYRRIPLRSLRVTPLPFGPGLVAGMVLASVLFYVAM